MTDKVLKLALEAGFDVIEKYKSIGIDGIDVREELHAFYTLARADLEAENAKLRKELDYFYMYMPTDVKNIVRAALGETK